MGFEFYNPADHYWIVAGDDSQAYSSARAAFVPADDAGYVAWLEFGVPTRIASFAELEGVLRAANVPPYRMIDGAEFLARLTEDEYGAIVSASMPGGSPQWRAIAKWLDIFRLRGEIDVTGATAQAAKAGLVAAGPLTSERAAVIFAGA